MLIEGEKINLRDIKLSDFDKVLKWSENKLLKYFASGRLPKDYKECESRYIKSSNLFNMIMAIEDKKGNFLGEIELSHIQWKKRIAELFIYIGEQKFWGKGYGTDALQTFIKYIYHEKGFNNIYLRVYQNNKRAIKCYQKCGFKKKGILRLKKNYAHIHTDNLILMNLNIPAFLESQKRVAFF